MGTFGTARFRIEAASAPFIPGVEKSKKTRSGDSSLAFSIPIKPSSTSPQTVNCSSSKNFRSAERIMALSSDFLGVASEHSACPIFQP